MPIARKYRKPTAHAQMCEFEPRIKGCCVTIWSRTFRFDSTFQEWNPRLPGSRPAKVTPIIYGHYLSQHAGARARAGRKEPTHFLDTLLRILMPELIIFLALLSGSLHRLSFVSERLQRRAQQIRKLCLGALSQPLSGCVRLLCPGALDPAEAGGHGIMVTFNGPKALAMSSVRSADARVQGSNFTPHHFKPFSSNEHYQQVMRALRKLQESGFYWGAMGGREASSTLRSEPPGTFLIRDSSDHHHFFTLSVQTARGTKNLRIHSEGGGFFLQPDPQNAHELPQFDCVLKLIAHYMGKGSEAGGRGGAGACGGDPGGAEVKARSVYLIHTGGERIPLELRRPLLTSLSSLQHLCRTTLNNRGLGRPEQSEQLPSSIKDYLEEYDAPI
ncbi:hypothetical protein fugu_000241 [Takifugu bimaculatus]|uniref:Uncharacterized protein n=1 Tax=Takifugu bimaculatus TaxID=433685 RepID=A0A4Z2CG57_9TELE|nr:hypothetical protein fugu_000241 [Takifugu bimaculatus]